MSLKTLLANANITGFRTENFAHTTAGAFSGKTKETTDVIPVRVEPKDTVEKFERRALFYAARKAGLPQKEANAFANANTDGKIYHTDHASVQNEELLKDVGKNVNYQLTPDIRADLEARRDDFVNRGGQLFSGREAPTKKISATETVSQKSGVDESMLRRAQIEQNLPVAANKLEMPTLEFMPKLETLGERARKIPPKRIELPTTPENAAKLSITIQSFIPMETVESPNFPLQAPFSPALFGMFEGDGREIDQRTVVKNGKTYEATYRTTQTVDVDFDMPEGVDVGVQTSGQSGISREKWRKDPSVAIRRDRADGTTLKATVRRDGDVITISAQGAEGNPLVSVAPAINYELKIYIEKQKDGSLKMTTRGKHDGFPAYEVFVGRPDGERNLAYGFDPRKVGNTPFDLYGDLFERTKLYTETILVPQPMPKPEK